MAVYTWEGNQVNITCEVFAYPSATISWFRDGQLLPSSNYSNIKIYNTPSASYLEVNSGVEKGRAEHVVLGGVPSLLLLPWHILNWGTFNGEETKPLSRSSSSASLVLTTWLDWDWQVECASPLSHWVLSSGFDNITRFILS